jgi:hypothetical protein
MRAIAMSIRACLLLPFVLTALLLALPADAALADFDFMSQPQDLGLPDDDPIPGVDPPYGNTTATTEPGENLLCGTQTMEATLWWSITGTGASIRFTTAGAHFDTVVAVYVLDGSGMRRIGCNDDVVPHVDVTSSFAWVSTPGARYRMQVGGCSGCGTPSRGNLEVHTRKADIDNDGDFDDCDDLDPSRAHGKPEVVGDGADQNCSGPSDRDDDGYDAGPIPLFDCVDANVDIHPGAVDIAHDGVDQNCDGADNKDEDGDGVDRGLGPNLDCIDTNELISPKRSEVPGNLVDEDCRGGPRPGLLERPTITFGNVRARGGGRRFGVLEVSGLRKGDKVTVNCRDSRRCLRQQRKTARSDTVRIGAYNRRVLRRGAKVRIFVVRPTGFFYGTFKQYAVRRGSALPRLTICNVHPVRPREPIQTTCSSN